MKRILITGANSYIGTSFEKYMKQFSGYLIDTINMRDEKWKEYNFKGYDSVFHVAGIAHADVGHVSEKIKKMYYKVNTELAIETAKYAKKAGVKQFIYMSSIIVYGDSAPLGKKKIISAETKPAPSNFYGDSKLQADIGLQKLEDDNFKVCILRPPMIYGPGSKGNYQMLSKIAKKAPIFPNIDNERSMLFIGNLCYFIKECIDKGKRGIFFPQNSEYVKTSEIVKMIAKLNNNKVIVTKVLNPFIFLLSFFPGKINKLCNKAFGNLTYEKENLNYPFNLEKSIMITEKRNYGKI